MLQSLHHLHSPLLDSLQYVHVSYVLGNPELEPALLGVDSPVLSRGEGSSAFTCWQCFARCRLRTPLALFAGRMCSRLMLKMVTTRTPKSFSAKLLSSWLAPQPVPVPGVVPPQVQDLLLPLVECQEVSASSSLKPVQVPLYGSLTLWHLNHSSQFFVIC